MDPWLLIGAGVSILVVATLLRLRLSIGLQARPIVAALAGVAAALALLSSAAHATHTELTYTTLGFYPAPTNNLKVYLSAPTHAESGTPGRECGWEENINGRHWNYYAAVVNTGGGFGSFYNRSYNVVVSNNPRDNNEYPLHVNYANNWGANVYIVTHTNALSGCPQTSASYLLVMYRDGDSNSLTLTNQLLNDVDPATPGGQSKTTCPWYECGSMNNAPYRAYVELFFHDNPDAKNWFQGNGLEGSGGVTESWRYGAAVDYILGFPR